MGIFSFFAVVFGLQHAFELEAERARAAVDRIMQRPEICGTAEQPVETGRLCEAVAELRGAAAEVAGLGLLDHDRPVFEQIVSEGIRRDLQHVARLDGYRMMSDTVEDAAVSLLNARATSLRTVIGPMSYQVEALPAEDRSRTILKSLEWL